MGISFQRKFMDIGLFPIALCSIFTGFFIGLSYREFLTNKFQMTDFNTVSSKEYIFNQSTTNITKIYVPTNPRGTERLAPGILEPYSDLSLHDILKNTSEDQETSPKYLLVLTVGSHQKYFIDNLLRKFSENFKIVLFHYDGKASEWDVFEWSKRAIHISARKQTKWWYAKRFLHPAIVAPYEYIFIWDEDLGVENFDGEEYIKLVKKYDLEISQPAATSKQHLTWNMTRKRENVEVHKEAREEGHPSCLHWPPCGGFIEIMAPVFSRNSWPCVWSIIQTPHEMIGVVDAQWIEHMVLPSLGEQGESTDGKAPWKGVRERCIAEWIEFRKRMREAEEKQLHH